MTEHAVLLKRDVFFFFQQFLRRTVHIRMDNSSEVVESALAQIQFFLHLSDDLSYQKKKSVWKGCVCTLKLVVELVFVTRNPSGVNTHIPGSLKGENIVNL